MNLQAKLRKIKRKKRGVSPIIAAILLIGLAVLAGAAIYVVVLPMLSPSTSSSDISATMSGTVDTTSVSGQATFTVSFANKGLKDVNVNITSVTMPYTFTSMKVNSGGSDITTTGVVVQAGKTVDVTITLTGGTVSVPSGSTITINTQLGTPVNAAKTFSLTT